MTAIEMEILAAQNNVKNQEGTALGSWIEYFEKLVKYLQFPGVVVDDQVNWKLIEQIAVCTDDVI